MGIEKTEMYVVSCDKCGDYYDNGDYQPVFGHKSDADNTVREDDWHKDGDQYYCRNCYTIDEETEEIIINP